MTQKEKGKERGCERRDNHQTPRRDDLDDIVNDSFPVSDPSSHSGITDVAGRRPTDRPDESPRPPSHQRGHDSRPTGHPTWERHAVETAHHWEDEGIF
jgi:hypothetical protein